MAFSKKWQYETNEDAEAKSFWDGFFDIFGTSRYRLASFEKRVKKIDGKDGYIDLLWKGVLLIEHKSRGKNLDRAHDQALDYFPGLQDRELPRYILVSDFARFRLYDLSEDKQHEFLLEDLHKNVHLFGFIAGYQTYRIKEQDPVNIKAAEQMGKLHDQMKAVGYEGHPLELYLVRLLFCLFAEDTGIFERQQFQEFVENSTREDGADLGDRLNTLFYVLNTPSEKRLKNRDESLGSFAFINGKLFEEMLPPASFDAATRQTLLDCCALDWGRISPAIFGSLFQSIMDKQARRNLGAHYTSEKNILKLIKPLFLDDLWAEFEKVKTYKYKLIEFHNKLRNLRFLDPACGCGNFLVISYRELRLLELEVLRASQISGQQSLDVHNLIYLDVDQFYGIEIEEFPAQIAQVALWLMDHQMNLLVSVEFGMYFARIPLASSANIVLANALRMDWNEVIPVQEISYILGNPPFIGKSLQSNEQKADMAFVFGSLQYKNLDFVSAWYIKSLPLLEANTMIRVGFVSTNSICQGEQTSVLWHVMLACGVSMHFAHRTFQWSSEAKGKAAVHCVIIGYGLQEVKKKRLFEYGDIQGEAHEVSANSINPYLVDAPNVVLKSRRHPVCNVTPMLYGSKPADGGHLLLDAEDKRNLLLLEPEAKPWIKPFLNASEFLNGLERYCLWLVDCPPSTLRHLSHIRKRVKQVRQMRLASRKEATRKLAELPSLFAEIRQSKHDYLLVPRHTSENRTYIPIGYFHSDVICGDANFQIPNASLYDFGIITSLMHNAWMRTVCGRIKSDYRYSNTIVYNNFPWPEKPSSNQIKSIEKEAQRILDARAKFPNSSLADLYDPLNMPLALLKAHQALNRVVDASYGKRSFKSEAS